MKNDSRKVSWGCGMSVNKMLLSVSLLLVSVPVLQGQVEVQRGGDNPIYKLTINVVQRTTPAIDYQHRSGSTTLDFKGTPLLPMAHGKIAVTGKKGFVDVEASVEDVQPATRFGPEYLTYVMWAVSPEGRPVNLGEVILDGDHGKLHVTSDLQSFALIVTAEPYFAVTQPSDLVVMENIVRPETKGQIEQVNAKYELLQRGQYTVSVPPAELKPISLDKKTPLDLYEARNALRIAHWAGADRDASDSYAKAKQLLDQAEGYLARNAGDKPISTVARDAVQTAEDARVIALKRQAENRLAQERAAAAQREEQARAAADKARVEAEQSAQRRIQAEQQQQLESERRARAEAERAAAEALAARTRAEADRARVQAEADAQRSAQEKAAAQAETDKARQLAEEQRLAAEKAEREKQELRIQLRDQLNKILETRESARGLIVNISDVLFDTGQYTLKPPAREKLAKVSGIVLAHPGLRLEVEGHTDSVGSDEFNQQLSEKRAATVRDFLTQQGIGINAVSARGFGKTMPVASNDTAAGRQLNRRVEMVVAGDVIGIPIGPSPALQGR
jgi:outer membrane protein OmpA-like peptidoglycan-associated protein